MLRVVRQSCVTALVLVGLACAEGGVSTPTNEPFDPDDDDSTGEQVTSFGSTGGDGTTGPISASSTNSGGGTGTTSGGENSGTSTPTGDVSSSGAASSGATGTPESQPVAGWWSHCTGTAECGGELSCLTNAAGDDGFCTTTCMPAGSAASCGGTANVGTSSCVTIEGASVCALSCATTSCPEPMVCVTDTVDSGPVEICI